MKGDKNNPIPVKDGFEAIDHAGRWCTYPNGVKVRFERRSVGGPPAPVPAQPQEELALPARQTYISATRWLHTLDSVFIA